MNLPLNQILIGDVREKLKELPDESVHCVVTSPPYWGLRDYGMAGQLGLEATPDEYVANLVAVFREVGRVLRPDGTFWLNIGDSYVGAMSQHKEGGSQGHNSWIAKKTMSGIPTSGRIERNRKLREGGLKPKDLVGIPWRVAFGLQEDGWYLRSDIIWAKVNPMPESVSDRPTKSHEYLFLFAKNERYYYDAFAVMEKNSPDMIERAAKGHTRGGNGKVDASRNDADSLRGEESKAIEANGRNRRSVWTISTEPFPDAHFATFPQALVEPCILAGTSEKGACTMCGKPWTRVVEKVRLGESWINPKAVKQIEEGPQSGGIGANALGPNIILTSKTTGWEKDCKCPTDDIAPCVVLDPFMGSGTTALVALRANRKFVGVELNPEYAEIAKNRIGPEAIQMRLM